MANYCYVNSIEHEDCYHKICQNIRGNYNILKKLYKDGTTDEKKIIDEFLVFYDFQTPKKNRSPLEIMTFSQDTVVFYWVYNETQKLCKIAPKHFLKQN